MALLYSYPELALQARWKQLAGFQLQLQLSGTGTLAPAHTQAQAQSQGSPQIQTHVWAQHAVVAYKAPGQCLQKQWQGGGPAPAAAAAALLYQDINAEQQACVVHKGAAISVTAGPGSGKTRVIIARIQVRGGGRGQGDNREVLGF